MNSSKNIYWIVSVLSLAGYAWVGFHFNFSTDHQHTFHFCFLKSLTGIPCVSCGITRSVIHILHGHIIEAMLINPLGLLACLVLIIAPFWVVYDFVKRKDTLPNSIRNAEALLRTQKIYLPLIVLGLLNWYWNIEKGL